MKNKKLRVAVTAFDGASEKTYEIARQKLLALVDSQLMEFTDEKPDLIFFASGGSERHAISLLGPGRMIMLAAFGSNNAFASAVEVKAYANEHGFRTTLLPLSQEQSVDELIGFHHILSGLSYIKGKKLGLLGEVSDWLVASSVNPILLKDKFGITIHRIPWSQAADYKFFDPSPSFLAKYNQGDKPGLNGAGQVGAALIKTIENSGVDAITVECFSLVKKEHVTACLALSDLNDQGFPAGCEGDITSIVGMMIGHAISGKMPWMANLSNITDDMVLFSHCTAPISLLDGFQVDTHFETGEGTAIRGKFSSEIVTVFRFDNHLSKIFITEGRIVNHPSYKNACRTQVELRLPSAAILSLKQEPLGNHHLILPGNHEKMLRLLAEVKGLKITGQGE